MEVIDTGGFGRGRIKKGVRVFFNFIVRAVFRALMPFGIVFPLCFCYSQHHFWLVYYVLDGRRLVLLHMIPHTIPFFSQ